MTMIGHVGGVPIEETLGMYGSALLLVLGPASARLGARLRRLRDLPDKARRGGAASLADDAARENARAGQRSDDLLRSDSARA
jgi:hypothetical protein